MKNQKKNSGPSTSRIADQRFASFETDPRFRLPSRKNTKTTIDKRFAGVFKDDDFTATAKVDRYGRKVNSDSKKKALQRLYRQDDDDEPETDEDEEDEEGGGEPLSVDDDDLVQRELLAAHEKSPSHVLKHDPARGGGFSSSESDSDSDKDSDEDDVEVEDIATEGDMQRLQDEQAQVETGEVTKRIAIVNLDWDHVRSTDLMALFSSFAGSGSGRVVKVSVYPSEFGKERMQQEEIEGPPKALFKTTAKDESSDDSSDDSDDEESEDEDAKIEKELLEEGDDQDFDSDALRSYQLDRLRYYYAVMICSSPSIAQKIYEATDGTEYQSSSNFIDLRFVPDDVTFDDEPRDECTKVPDSYKPVDFVTNALQSSKVKLTWDLNPDDASRKESINRAFTGSRAQIQDNDLRAYLASGSEDDSDSDEEAVEDPDANEDGPKLSKKQLARKKMREALGLGDEPTPRASKDAPVGDMEITFAPALEDNKQKDDDKDETTIEKYRRKERERKEAKRQDAKARRETTARIADERDSDKKPKATNDDTTGFDDPFFTTEEPDQPTRSSIRKEERRKKREEREAAEAASAEQKAQLTKVMAEDAGEDQVEHLDHFDMNEIMRAEKQQGKKKGKYQKKKEASEGPGGRRGGLQEDFEMDVDDDRFKAVFDSHEFAIDPSNPKFKGTAGMKKLLEEGRKKRKGGEEGEDGRTSKKVKKGRR